MPPQSYQYHSKVSKSHMQCQLWHKVFAVKTMAFYADGLAVFVPDFVLTAETALFRIKVYRTFFII